MLSESSINNSGSCFSGICGEEGCAGPAGCPGIGQRFGSFADQRAGMFLLFGEPTRRAQWAGATLSLAGEAYLQLGDAKASEQAFAMAVKAARACGYVSAGTVEMLRGGRWERLTESKRAR